MGLRFESDLEAWLKWQDSRHPIRTAWRSLRTSTIAPLTLLVHGNSPRLLIGMDSLSPTSISSLVTPLKYFSGDVAILLPTALLPNLALPWLCMRHDFPNPDLSAVQEKLPDLTAVAALGNYLPVGSIVCDLAKLRGLPIIVIQHGLLSPFAPPLPKESHLLSFTKEDAEFWIGSRPDVSHTLVGMQSLWSASSNQKTKELNSKPVFLGQLHGSEIERSVSIASATTFCLETGASYRPHPSETDLLSRNQHKRWLRMGIEIDATKVPLRRLDRPVVSIFSTGILEAAALGLPAWSFAVGAPKWLQEFWQRYNINQWGGIPTPSPVRLSDEPAILVAQEMARIVLNKK